MTNLGQRDEPQSGGRLYPYDILGANFSIVVDLLETSGSSDFLNENGIETVLDVGAANGDLSFVFARAGFETTLVDLSISYSKAPLVASLINLQLGADVRVDLSVDGHFGYHDIINYTVNSRQFTHRSRNDVFDLVICFGLLYHLKNPIAFLESLHKICRYCMLGTWLMSFFPDNVTRDKGDAHNVFAGSRRTQQRCIQLLDIQ